jgi:hypothetical protein
MQALLQLLGAARLKCGLVRGAIRRTDLASRRAVQRVLLVMRGPIDTETVRRRWESVEDGTADLAICYELPSGSEALPDAVQAQRAITEALRAVCGARAEAIAIFAVTDRDGDRVADYAREWGATRVSP